MNVLIGAEHSGVVREAFRRRGHNAWSCDLLPADDNSPFHLQGDLRHACTFNNDQYFPNLYCQLRWDLAIFHPPCTYLANSGVKHLYIGGKKINGRYEPRWRDLAAGAALFEFCLGRTGEGYQDIPRRAVENPIMHLHARQLVNADPDQIVQPWMFGHKEMKATCFWLHNLPPLLPTNVVGPPPQDRELRKKWARVHRESPGPDRWKRRSVTYPGIADAMAERWGQP